MNGADQTQMQTKNIKISLLVCHLFALGAAPAFPLKVSQKTQPPANDAGGVR
jgi:hypothetical protein